MKVNSSFLLGVRTSQDRQRNLPCALGSSIWRFLGGSDREETGEGNPALGRQWERGKRTKERGRDQRERMEKGGDAQNSGTRAGEELCHVFSGADAMKK